MDTIGLIYLTLFLLAIGLVVLVAIRTDYDD